MKLFGFLIAAMAVALAAEDEPLKGRAQILAERQKLYPEIARIVEATHGVPQEFAAEALLRAAEAPFLADRDWKKELIEDAFQHARQAKEPVARKVAVMTATSGTRASMIAQAAATGLDRVTLEMRAVRDELALDKVKGREFFATAGKPAVRRASCDDALVDNVAAYYETLARVVDGGFTSEEKQKDAHVQLLAAELRKITSPVEVGPAARAIMTSNLTAAQLEFVVSAFSAALQKISGDDRAFSSALVGTDRDLETLLDKLRAAGVSVEPLTTAYRQYLTQNFAGARCEDTITMKPDVGATIGGGGPEPVAATFGGIDPSTIKPSKVQGKPKLQRFITSEQGGSFRAAFDSLMFGSGGRGLRDDQKVTPQWRERFTTLARSIDEMKRESSEPAADFFYRKAGAYIVALTAAPPGPERDGVVLQYIGFLRTSDMQQEDVVAWFSQVDALVSLTQSVNAEEYRKLLAALTNSGHPVLRLYAEEESSLPQRPAWAR